MNELSLNRFINESDLEKVLVFADTETTGFNEKTDSILEIALIATKDKKIISQYHTYIDPGESVNIPSDSAKVHGITNEIMAEMRKNYIRYKHGETLNENEKIAIPLNEAWPEIIKILNGNYFIAHNARFDMKFLLASEQKLLENNPKLPRLNIKREIDTITIAKILIPRGHVTLDALCNKFDVDKSSRARFHGAMIDTLLLMDVFWKMIEANNKTILDVSPKENKKSGRKIRQRTGVVIKPTKCEASNHNRFITNKIKS